MYETELFSYNYKYIQRMHVKQKLTYVGGFY